MAQAPAEALSRVDADPAPAGAAHDLPAPIDVAVDLAQKIHFLRAVCEAAHAGLSGPRHGDVDVGELLRGIADDLIDLEPVAEKLLVTMNELREKAGE